jgi:hypothetical protein
MALLLCPLGVSVAENDTPAAVAPAPVLAKTASIVDPAAAPIKRVEVENDDASAAAADAVHFTTEARWMVAGYNNDEIVFTIFLNSDDARIIRCTTSMKGSYFENGEKLEIADRQVTTVFPKQRAQAGNWLGMDQKSGATYSVKCKPL